MTKLKDEFVQEQKSSDTTTHSSGDQETTDPLIDEAVKLVGEDLIEWADKN